MHRKSLFSVIGVLLGLALLLPSPTAAQDNDGWAAYLYHSTTNTLVSIHLAGNTAAYDLGLAEGSFLSTWEIDFSPDGRLLAYCQLDWDNSTATLIVRDLPMGRDLAVVDLGPAIACSARNGFSVDGEQVVVGVIHYYPYGEDVEDDLPLWSLYVMDATSGEILHELDHTAAALTEAGLDTETMVMPETRVFAGDALIFTAMTYAVGGTPPTWAFTWNLATGDLQAAEAWAYLVMDWLPETNERIWLTDNHDYPAAAPTSPVPGFNVLMIGDGSDAETIIYNNSDYLLENAQFINNGRQVALTLAPGTGVESWERVWLALDRDGTLTALQAMDAYALLRPAPDGYVFFSDADGMSPMLIYGSGEDDVELWSKTEAGWDLIWVMPTAVVEDLEPFAAWDE